MRKINGHKILLPLLSLLLIACQGRQQPSREFNGFGLGTFYSVIAKGTTEDLTPQIDSVIAAANASMSVFDANSLLSRLNRNETDIVGDQIAYCIELARRVSVLSAGKYDITVQPLVEAYGFSGGRQNEQVDVDSLLQLVGYEKIEVREGRLIKRYPGIKIGLNSIAKGYTVDLVARMLEERGIGEYLVNIGGEIFCRGLNRQDRRWTVGIETPYEGNYVQGNDTRCTLYLSDAGLATSGNYRNFHTDSQGRKFTHIIDPLTGKNTASNLLSASVISESCALADALGTMFIAVGLDGAKQIMEQHPDIAVLLIYADGQGDMKLLYSDAMTQYMESGS